MWGSLGVNVKGFVGAALENVQKLSQDLEAEMNAAVSSNEEEEKRTRIVTEQKETDVSLDTQDDARGDARDDARDGTGEGRVIEENKINIDEMKTTHDDDVDPKDDLIEILSTNETVEQKKTSEKKVRKNLRKQPSSSANESPQPSVPPHHVPPEINDKSDLTIEGKDENLPRDDIPKTLREEKSPDQVEIVQVPEQSERVKPPKRGKKVKSSPDTIKELPVPKPQERKIKDLKKDLSGDNDKISIQDNLLDDHSTITPESPPIQLPIEEYEIISTQTEIQQIATESIDPLQQIDYQPQFEAVPPPIPEKTREISDTVLVPSENTGTNMKVQFYETKVEESHRHYFERKIEALHHEISSLATHNEHLVKENQQLVSQIQEQTILFENSNLKLSSQMKGEMDQLNEVIAERERALQSANVQLADLHQRHEEAMTRVMTLTSEVTENKKLMKQFQMAATGEGNENKRELMRLQELLKEKEENLTAYAVEGQALSKKQVFNFRGDTADSFIWSVRRVKWRN